MSLNPLRKELTSAGLASTLRDSPFRAEADAALAGFRAVREDLERRVRRGEMTVKVARERAGEAAVRLRDLLVPKAERYSPVPRAFQDRLVQAVEARKAARERGSLEALQRETNRLLKRTLVEQQLGSRVAEFEARTFVRPMGGGNPSPTLDSLLRFHEASAQAGDDAAMEWARRQLEAMRKVVFEPEDTRRIDRACERPDQLSPPIVERYVEALREASPETIEGFVAQALAERDANACTAAFVLAREAPEGGSARWVRDVLDGLGAFPDAALNALRALEAEARDAEAEAAQGRAQFAFLTAQADARLSGVEAPSVAELERMDRTRGLPVAAEGEPIGLALGRRGFLPEDEGLATASPES